MHFVNTAQLIDLAQSKDIPGHEELAQQIEMAQSQLADKVAKHFGILHLDTSSNVDEVASNFGPAVDDQPCPESMKGYDESSSWVLEEG